MFRRLSFLAITVLLAFTDVQGQSVTRRGLFRTGKAEARLNDNQEFGSMFTLGTMFGVSYSQDDPSTYKVENGIVVLDDERQKLQPAVFALPSIALLGVPGKSLAAILPVNLNTAGETNYGVGISLGFNVRKSAEIGFSLVAIWSNQQRLTAEQRNSVDKGSPLPTGASTDFRTAKRPGLGIGIYIVPIL